MADPQPSTSPPAPKKPRRRRYKEVYAPKVRSFFKDYAWFASRNSAYVSIFVTVVWQSFPFIALSLLAGLQTLPKETLHAASVDGASLWRKVWHVTVPQIRGVLLVMFMLQIIGTAQVFLEPYLFTSGGPANATLTLLLLVYQYAFGNSIGVGFGQAAALSLMVAVFLAIFSLVFLRLTRSWSTT